jgi:dTMP kinase
MFIVFEGADCSGKTTQAARLAKRLRANLGFDVLHLVFPGKSPAGVVARKLLQLDKLLADSINADASKVLLQSAMLADRYGSTDEIRNCLRHGGIVITDRWSASGLVYGGEDGLDVNWLAATQTSLPEPNLHILLDVDVTTVMARLKARGASPEVYENVVSQQNIITRYRNLWAKHRESGEWRIVDGRMTEVAVADTIYKLVAHRMGSFLP